MSHRRILSKVFTLLLLAGLSVAGIHAQVPNGSLATARITAEVDDTNLFTLQGNVSGFAEPANDQGAASGSLELGRAILVLKPSAAQQAALDRLTDQQQNSKSPNYHAWLTPAEYGSRFGVAQQDLDKIDQWLLRHGFTVEPQMPGRNLIIFSGTNAQLKEAFHTEMHNYKLKGQIYTSISADPQLPAAFREVIRSFSPNDFPLEAEHTVSKLIQHTEAGWKEQGGANEVAGAKPQITTPNPNGGNFYLVGPYDLATIYNILPLWNAGIDGTGETIAIVSDSNIAPADIDMFRSEFGLPAKKLNILVNGADPGRNGDEIEADLDVQFSGAVAKNATIDLVVSADTAASQGIVGSMIYIINNNTAPLMNISYGACEQAFGTQNNELFSYFFEQAASQGMTVLSAAGDALVAACDRGSQYDEVGMDVNTLATTQYSVSVGGTDFSGNYPDASKYWSATNDPTTEQSVLSYIPETPWNDSCANPVLLSALHGLGVTTDQTPLALCNDGNPNVNGYQETTGAGGGASNCFITGPDATNPCISGLPKPAWQSGVAGIPNDGVRDQPDVSLMSGNGLWGSAYPICDSDYSGGPCNSAGYALAGGTSFATPIFAGMLALVQQQHGLASLGNVNYVLYKLGAAEYASTNATACVSSNVTAGNSCVFYDITQGTIAAPCEIFTPDCDSFGMTQQIGITTGYDAGPGYDLASGLGSVNTYNLVEQWNSVASTFIPTVTTLTAAPTIVYGQNISMATTVAPVAPATGVPSGDVGFISNDTAPGTASLVYVTLSKGAGTVSTPLLSAGTYQLFANYEGDATFAPSESAGSTVTVTKATPVSSLTTTRSSVQTGQNVTFSLIESGVLNGFPPTGTVVLTDTTTGAVLPISTLPTSGTYNGVPYSIWLTTLSSSQIDSGATVSAVYSGDSNYVGATATPVTVTQAQAAFTTSFSQSSVTLTNGTGTLAVTVTPIGPTPLTPGSIVLSCPAAVDLTCTFSPNVVGSNGVLTSTLTVTLVSSATASAASPIRKQKNYLPPVSFAGAIAGLLLLTIPKRRRNYSAMMLSMVMLCGLMMTVGCSSLSHSSPVSQPSLISTSTVLSFSPTAPVLGGAVLFTAKVTPVSGSGVPTGSVTFSAGDATLGTSVMKAGSATFTTSSLPLGSQAVIALYKGDADYNISSSAVAMVSVSGGLPLTVTATNPQGSQSSANVQVIVH